MTLCAPGTADNRYSCFTNESLMKIANEYNSQFTDDQIVFSKKEFNRNEVWKAIKKKMMRFTPNCDKNWCLLNNPVLKNLNDPEITERTFRPEMPKNWNDNPTEWLSTLDIQSVMEQYEFKYTDFKFIGPVPIDFDHKIIPDMCVSDELCKIDLKNLYKQGMRKLGIIFNLDPHYRGGSHWVTMFLDMKTGGIYYFDSVGSKPPGEIVNLMNKLKIQGNNLIMTDVIDIDLLDNSHSINLEFKPITRSRIKIHAHDDNLKFVGKTILLNNAGETDLNQIVKVKDGNLVLKHPLANKEISNFVDKGFKIFYNKKQFQYKDSECGIYAIHFLEQFLLGKKFNELESAYYTDEEMILKRSYYFRNSK